MNSKHTEEQIIGVLKQVEAGWTVKELARELGVSEATIYTWKSKFRRHGGQRSTWSLISAWTKRR
jgi:transposase